MLERPGGVDREVIIGVVLTLGLHLAAGVLLIAAAAASTETVLLGALFFFLVLGVSQFVYMLPAILIAFARGRRSLAHGLIIGAAITFLLNASCWAGLNPEGIPRLLRGGSIF